MEQIDRDKTIEELEYCVNGGLPACSKCDYATWDNKPVMTCRPLIEKALQLMKAARDSTINYALLNVAHQLARGKGPVNLTREDARLFRDLLEKQIKEQRNTSTEEGG